MSPNLQLFSMAVILTIIDVDWEIFAAPIVCGTEILGSLCRRLMEFLTRSYLQTSLPDMLTLEWYYGEAGLDHNDKYICVITRLTQKRCTAKKSLIWLWHHFWQGRLKINTILSYIKIFSRRALNYQSLLYYCLYNISKFNVHFFVRCCNQKN